MTARERILALRLLEKQEQMSDYIRGLGIEVSMVQKVSENEEDKHV